MPIIIAEFHIQPDVVGLIGASLVFGAVIGAGVGGPMADHLGRKKLMLADMIIIAAGACISALANGPAMLFIGQLLVGIGVGIDFPVSSSYVSEILPKPSRARMMVATIACQSVGMLLAAAITLALAKERKRSGLAAISGDRRRSCPALFCLTSVGTRKSALVDVSRQICRGGASFHSDHSRATTGSVATYRQPREARSSGSARKRWAADPVFASLSGAHGAGNYPLVSDGYCYVRRWIVYPDNSRSDRNLRKNAWIDRARLCSRKG